jgi:hypothetical protein
MIGHPVWAYPESLWSDPTHQIGPQHDELRRRIVEHLGTTGSLGDRWTG